MSLQPKPLTVAQHQYLLALNAVVMQAQANLDGFVAYLREEHGAPGPAWQLSETGQAFVCIEPEQEGRDA